MRILDLFCKAGGASKGLSLAFPDAEIIGVDIEHQRNYPFRFELGDALDFPLTGFDLIWASPPCQAHTALKSAAWDKDGYKKKHSDLIPATRERLVKSGIPYAIENVMGAPLLNPTMLCGSMFKLRASTGHQLRRHRIFECSFKTHRPHPCFHFGATIGIFGDKARNTAEEKKHYSKVKTARGKPPVSILLSLDVAREAMGIDWMTMSELAQAIPPAFSRWIGEEFKRERET